MYIYLKNTNNYSYNNSRIILAIIAANYMTINVLTKMACYSGII